jgi:hypothetical protein
MIIATQARIRIGMKGPLSRTYRLRGPFIRNLIGHGKGGPVHRIAAFRLVTP